MLLHPFMMKNALQIQAILGLIFQQFTDDVTGAICHMLRKSQIHAKIIQAVIELLHSMWLIKS
jgi:hypothetical protein